MSELQRANDAQLNDLMQRNEPGRFLRAELVAWNLFRRRGGRYHDKRAWEMGKVHMLKELHLRLHEGSEVQKLRLCIDDDLKGVRTETISFTTIKLEQGEKVIGFRMNVLQSQSGSNVYFGVQVVLRSEDGVRAEPLSREQLPARHPEYPGRQCSLESKGNPKTEMSALRFIRGQHRDHLLGPVYHTWRSWHDIEGATGQDAMFWLDLFVLTGGLYYLDVVTDVQQITLFFAEGQYEYFALSCLGVAIPMVATVIDAVRWSEDSLVRPQSDAFRRSLPSALARRCLIFTSVLTQGHMILLVLTSMHMRVKHDLLLGAKHAEVAEAAISVGLQTNFWFLIMVGMQSVSFQDFQSLTLSILISLASLAFGFASRDKNDARVLGVPGKLGWEPIFIALFLMRAMEVTSRLLALNMLHLATRTAFPLGGPVAIGLLVASANFCFREAEKVHVLAAALAHPGQIFLGNLSRMPLRYSLAMHVFLQAVAVALQALIPFNEGWLPEAKEVPWPIIAASVAGCFCSSVGLCALAHYGNKMEHPFLENVALGKPITCTMLATAVELPRAPTAVYAMAKAKELWLDVEALSDPQILKKLASAQARVCINSSSMQKLEMIPDGWAELCHLNVINVDFTGCHFADAPTEGISKKGKQSQRQSTQTVSRWAFLAWFQLEVVLFQEAGNAAMLDIVAQCHELREIKVLGGLILDAPWERLPQARWPNLRVAEFVHCFCHSQIAAAVLQALATCPKLECLAIGLCLGKEGEEPPQQVVLKALSEAHWPELRDVSFDFGVGSGQAAMAVLQCLARSSQLETLCFDTLSGEGFDGASLGDVEALEQIRGAHWPKLRRADFTRCFIRDDSQGFATEVLKILARCSELQRLQFDRNKWPMTQAWDEKLEQGCWPKLHWEECNFGSNCPSEKSRPQQATPVTEEEPATAESVEKFPKYLTYVEVLGAPQMHSLAKCRHLQVVYICDYRNTLPAAAWLSLEMAAWPELRVVSFFQSFQNKAGRIKQHFEGAHAALGLLARCKLLEEINLGFCSSIPAEAWERLKGAEWPLLRKADFHSTFLAGTSSCSKAAMVMEVLGKCSQLVELECTGTSAAAFKQLPDGCWPLLDLKRVGVKGLERLCRTEEPAADSTAILVLEKDTQTEPQGPGTEIADNEDDVAEPEKVKMKRKKKKRWVTKTKGKRQDPNPPASTCE